MGIYTVIRSKRNEKENISCKPKVNGKYQYQNKDFTKEVIAANGGNPSTDRGRKEYECNFSGNLNGITVVDDLKKGDILVRKGHIEIFYGYDRENMELALTWGKFMMRYL